MSLITNGITKVRAYELPAGIWPDGNSFGCPRIALVKWHSNRQDKLYQVYVNRQFAAVTVDVSQRQVLVHLSGSFAAAAQIEVFAVEPRFAHIDFSDDLTQMADTGRIKLRILRSQLLPLASAVQIYGDNGTGTIDYDKPLNAEPIRVWPSFYDKVGFGLSSFAQGDFGFECAAAVGFGLGDFGLGQFGLDADSIEWTTEPLSKGVYKFGVTVTDKNGHVSDAVETDPVTIIPAALPATKLDVFSFDKQANELVLSVN